jgi:signal peptidase II
MSRNKKISWLGLAIFLFVVVRASQLILFFKLPDSGYFVFNGLIGLKYYANPGLVFGWPMSRGIIIIISLVVICFLVGYLFKTIKNNQPKNLLPLIFILTGAFGNLVERLRFGYVMDFFQIWILPVFNLADLFIFSGVIWLLVLWFNQDRIAQKR